MVQDLTGRDVGEGVIAVSNEPRSVAQVERVGPDRPIRGLDIARVRHQSPYLDGVDLPRVVADSKRIDQLLSVVRRHRASPPRAATAPTYAGELRRGMS